MGTKQRTPRVASGDRVRTIRQLLLLPAGSLGTVIYVYPVRNLCDVRFDNWPKPRVMACSDLELVDETDQW
jgi:hypothetical protein